MKTALLINFKVTVGSFSQFINSITCKVSESISCYICVANVHMFIEAQRDNHFRRIINSADIVTPDGKPLSWALRLLNGIKQERIAGMDLFPFLLQSCEKRGISVYFYGGSQEMLDQVLTKAKTEYPSLKISGAYSPPFRPLTDVENENIVEKINKAGPQLILVALGCPKQERWMYNMKGKINAVMIGLGGALPVYAGIQKRAPLWMQKSGLEWLFRLFQEPRRLFKRYAVTNTMFIAIVLKALFLKIFFNTHRVNSSIQKDNEPSI